MNVAGKTGALYFPARRSDYDHTDPSQVDVIAAIDVSGTVAGFVPFSEVFRYLGSRILTLAPF